MITVTGLSKSYNGKKVVDDLSFTMKERGGEKHHHKNDAFPCKKRRGKD